MARLIIERNQASYVAVLSQPVFSLWGKGGVILEGLYNAFRDLGITLADIRAESGTAAPSDEAVAVFFGAQASFRFKFDRLEGNLSNFSDQELVDFAKMLGRGDAWIRSSTSVTVSSHLFSYSAHARFEETTSEEFLRGLASPQLKSLGESRGTGLIWHGKQGNTLAHLTVDHSVVIENGLFIQFIVVSFDDRIDHLRAVREGEEQFFSAIRELELIVPGWDR